MSNYKKIEFQQLHKADIIFTTDRNSAISTTIRTATNSICSHTMLVADGSHVIEAISDGVAIRSWSEAKIDCSLAIAMRRKLLLNGADQDKVISAARAFENLPYDTLGAAGSGMDGNRRNQNLALAGCVISVIGCAALFNEIQQNAKDENADNKFFCSELVSRAFTIAGFPVIEGKATNTHPGALYLSSWLEYVGHLIYIPPPNRNLTEEQKERNRKAGYRKDN